jgi:hypothetical protein
MEAKMSQILLVAGVLCAAAVLSPEAWADFRLRPAPPVAAVRTPMPGTRPAADTDSDKPPLAQPQPKFAVTHGFGRQVPLSFAVRQIVPRSIRVIYANDVDAAAVVNWTGGQEWNVVLSHAVAPLGLHIQVAPTIVTIYR